MKTPKYQIKKMNIRTLTLILLMCFVAVPSLVQSQTRNPRPSELLVEVKLDGHDLRGIHEIVLPEITYTTMSDTPRDQESRWKTTNIILKQIVSEDRTLYEWFRETAEANSQEIERFKKDITVELLRSDTNPKEQKWVFRLALPIRYQPFLFEGKMIETLELKFESWERLRQNFNQLRDLEHNEFEIDVADYLKKKLTF